MRDIRSADNPKFRQALKLRDSSRERRKRGLTLLDGVHLVQAYMARVAAPEVIFVAQSRQGDAEIAAVMSAASVEPHVLSDSLFAKLSSVATPTGIAAIVTVPRPAPPDSAGACVLLEDVQDPGNVGSILRSAAAAGIREVYLSSECADAWSPRVLRAAMGAHFVVRLVEDVDPAGFAKDYPGRIVATAGDGEMSIYEADLTGRVGLVFGNEGTGITAAIRASAHAVVSVPISAGVESLNVAAAAAVCLFERVRQTRAQ